MASGAWASFWVPSAQWEEALPVVAEHIARVEDKFGVVLTRPDDPEVIDGNGVSGIEAQLKVIMDLPEDKQVYAFVVSIVLSNHSASKRFSQQLEAHLNTIAPMDPTRRDELKTEARVIYDELLQRDAEALANDREMLEVASDKAVLADKAEDDLCRY